MRIKNLTVNLTGGADYLYVFNTNSDGKKVNGLDYISDIAIDGLVVVPEVPEEKISARYNYSRRQLMGTTKIPSSRRYSEPRAVSTIRNEGAGSGLFSSIFSFNSVSE